MNQIDKDAPRKRWHQRYRAARIAHHRDAYAEMPMAALLFSLAVWTILVYVGWLVVWAVF